MPYIADTIIQILGTITLQVFALLNISRIKIVLREFAVVVGMLTAIMFICFVYMDSEVLGLIAVTLGSALYLYIKNKNILLSLFFIIITYILIFAVNNIYSILALSLFGITIEMFRDSNLLYLIATAVMTIIIYLISKPLGLYLERWLISVSVNGKMNRSFKFILAILMTLLLISSASIFLIMPQFQSEYLFIISSVLLVVVFILIVLILYLYFVYIKKDLETKYNKEQLSPRKSIFRIFMQS